MATVLLPGLHNLNIALPGGEIAFGPSQLWYDNRWQRQAGCGPATLAGQCLYLASTLSACAPLYPGEVYPSGKLQDYRGVRALMDRTWDAVTPGPMGVNRLSMLADGGVAYAAERDVVLASRQLRVGPGERPTTQEATAFLTPPLLAGLPVAFLNLSAGKLTNLESWHWVLLVGLEMDDGACIAIISDQGQRKRIDLGLWLATSRMGGGFVFFQPGRARSVIWKRQQDQTGKAIPAWPMRLHLKRKGV
ncbi:MAG: hypothetical protein ACK5LX_12835 [Oscillospiraceae bacterium]